MYDSLKCIPLTSKSCEITLGSVQDPSRIYLPSNSGIYPGSLYRIILNSNIPFLCLSGKNKINHRSMQGHSDPSGQFSRNHTAFTLFTQQFQDLSGIHLGSLEQQTSLPVSIRDTKHLHGYMYMWPHWVPSGQLSGNHTAIT